MFSVGILVVSDKGFRGEREDKSGPVIANSIEKFGGKVIKTLIVPDERSTIACSLADLCDVENLDLVLSTGGTGFSKRDVTPEATLDVIEKNVPGFTELIRSKSSESNSRAILSRAVAGIRKETLIVNLPGSPKGAIEAIEIIGPSLVHGIDILKGIATECASHNL